MYPLGMKDLEVRFAHRSPKERFILARDKYTCQICFGSQNVCIMRRYKTTLNLHTIPQYRINTDEYVAACHSCLMRNNAIKSARDAKDDIMLTVLQYASGRTMKQISQKLGISTEAVRKRLIRAKERGYYDYRLQSKLNKRNSQNERFNKPQAKL